jgi:hypothetical protein
MKHCVANVGRPQENGNVRQVSFTGNIDALPIRYKVESMVVNQ